MTKPDHKYFRNTDCQYFPCHKMADDSFYNCLFCFCPLYWLQNCGGNPADRDGVKDCTGCTLPHRPGGYEHIIDRLKQEFEHNRTARKTKNEQESPPAQDAPDKG
ncbi:cysteine-rich small domain-containing protein [Desulfovibrio ferrophilus]|uniref:Cysteine-rich small domain-containing protein n=1 Tax=Desulfovibrio ferrophilus TaxID=241368 RepID=A0A2Z6B3I6_9BACT|nr:cysteine-rich small domain-containing protein [Desulfovibrio ferrophilus]BBD10062.1 cysteine-rich small domain-containing protein [Desulfovibrio ferrophilus]